MAKRGDILISVSKLKSNTNVSEEENWPNIPIPILPCYPFWPVILARPAVPNSNLLIWTPRGFLRSEMKYLLFSQNSWNSSSRAFPEPKIVWSGPKLIFLSLSTSRQIDIQFSLSSPTQQPQLNLNDLETFWNTHIFTKYLILKQ